MGTRPVWFGGSSVVHSIMRVSRPVAWMSWISEEARRVAAVPPGSGQRRKFYGRGERTSEVGAKVDKKIGAHVGSRPFPVDSLFDRGCEPVLQTQSAEQVQQQHDEKNGTEDAHASTRAP